MHTQKLKCHYYNDQNLLSGMQIITVDINSLKRLPKTLKFGQNMVTLVTPNVSHSTPLARSESISFLLR